MTRQLARPQSKLEAAGDPWNPTGLCQTSLSPCPCALQLGAKSIPVFLCTPNGEIIKKWGGWGGKVNTYYYRTMFSGKAKRWVYLKVLCIFKAKAGVLKTLISQPWCSKYSHYIPIHYPSVTSSESLTSQWRKQSYFLGNYCISIKMN